MCLCACTVLLNLPVMFNMGNKVKEKMYVQCEHKKIDLDNLGNGSSVSPNTRTPGLSLRSGVCSDPG